MKTGIQLIFFDNGVMKTYRMPEEPIILPLTCNVKCDGYCGDVCPEIRSNRIENERQIQVYKNKIQQARASALPVADESKEKVNLEIWWQCTPDTGDDMKLKAISFDDWQPDFTKEYRIEAEFEEQCKACGKDEDDLQHSQNICCSTANKRVVVLVEEERSKIKKEFAWMTSEKAERLSKPAKFDSLPSKEESQEELLKAANEIIQISETMLNCLMTPQEIKLWQQWRSWGKISPWREQALSQIELFKSKLSAYQASNPFGLTKA